MSVDDELLKTVKEQYDAILLDFIRRNSTQLLQQADSDPEFVAGVRDVPRVALFDDFLSRLEAEIEQSLVQVGIHNGAARKMVSDYKDTFYRSSLPNLGYGKH